MAQVNELDLYRLPSAAADEILRMDDKLKTPCEHIVHGFRAGVWGPKHLSIAFDPVVD